MPELPEVETIRRGLAPTLTGAMLRRVEILDPRWCAPLEPARIADALQGRRIEAVARRGKYLLWRLADEVHLLVHLRMTGTLLLDPPTAAPHARVRFELTKAGTRHTLVFDDPRRFGTGQLLLGAAALAQFLAARLGPEPFDGEFTPQAMRAAARGRSAPIKAFLLDQRRIAGIGNIYADEALYRARIHPLRRAGDVTRAQWEALVPAIVEVLTAGIDARGASIDDFRDVDGVRGAFQDRFLVHRRAGEPCGRCGRPIVKLVAAGRGTYICRGCTPTPRARRR